MKLIFIILMLFSLCGCQRNETADIFAMDTIISFDVYGKNTGDAIKKMKSEILRIDKKFSPSAKISEDEETKFIKDTAKKVSTLTGGAFDLRVSDIMELWGFRDKNYRIPSDEEIKEAKNSENLDFGGIAKGYAGDCLKKIAEENGITSGILSLGGNITAIGTKSDGKPWKVGIADPKNSTEYTGHFEVFDQSVVTSGAYQRYFEQDGKIYHHIINPKTGKPSNSGLLSVTIISESGILADALSTACFVLGADKTIELYNSKKLDFEAVLVENNGDIITTEKITFHRKD